MRLEAVIGEGRVVFKVVAEGSCGVSIVSVIRIHAWVRSRISQVACSKSDVSVHGVLVGWSLGPLLLVLFALWLVYLCTVCLFRWLEGVDSVSGQEFVDALDFAWVWGQHPIFPCGEVWEVVFQDVFVKLVASSTEDWTFPVSAGVVVGFAGDAVFFVPIIADVSSVITSTCSTEVHSS